MTTLPPTSELPDNPAFLKQLIVELREEIKSSRRLQEQLQHQLEQLMRKLFGRQSEKLDPNQLTLLFAELQSLGLSKEDSEEEDDEPPSEPSRRRRRGGHGRRRLPKHLRRERREYRLSEAELKCSCGACLSECGEDVSEQLEYQPAEMFVIEHARIRYACRQCEETVRLACKPPQPIDKGLPGPGLLAQVVTSKYGDHLPLYRLEGMFDRLGVSLSRSTMCDWVGAAADLLSPLVGLMKDSVLASKKIHTDDTSVPILDSSLGQTRRGRLWVYLGHEPHDHTVFDYTPSRERDGPAAYLKDFSGYLQADAYSGYDGIYSGGKVMEVACWAHARRKFIEINSVDSGAPFTALAFIGQLYQIERKSKDLSSVKRRDFRQEHARPVLNAFKKWLDEQARTVRPKSLLAKAIGYALRQWEALVRYTEDGDLNIDNNAAERALRRIAVGRKNWLFAGNDEGARRTAILYSIIASCHQHSIDPFLYLRDILSRIPSHAADDLAELTPKAWAEAQRQADSLAQIQLAETA